MTNTDQSNHAATSPTNSEAVRSGDWLGDAARWWDDNAKANARAASSESLNPTTRAHCADLAAQAERIAVGRVTSIFLGKQLGDTLHE